MRRLLALALIAAASAAPGCVSESEESDDAIADGVATRMLWSSYELAEMPAGAIAAIARNTTGDPTLLVRLGRTTERTATLPAAKLPQGDAPWKYAKNRIYKVGVSWRPNGPTRFNLVSVSLTVKAGVLTPTIQELWSTQVDSGDVPPRTPSFDVDAEGKAYVVYGEHSTVEDKGFQLVSCAANGPCETRTVLADPDARGASAAVVTDGAGVVVALRGTKGPAGRVQILSGAPSSLASVTLSDPAYAYGSVLLARGAGRVVLGVHGKDGLSVLERSGGAWQPTAHVPRLVREDARTELAVTEGDVIVKSELDRFHGESLASGKPIAQYVRFARIFRQSDGFAGQDLPADRWRGDVLLASGEVFFVGDTGTGIAKAPTYEKTPGTPLRFREASRGAGSLEAGRDPCLWEQSAKGGTPMLGAFRLAPSSWSPYSGNEKAKADTRGEHVILVPAGEVLTIRAGTCLYAHGIVGDGEVRLEGTEEAPIHVLGTILGTKTVKATWAFLDGMGDNGVAPAHPAPRGPLGETGSLDHVSMMREGKFRVAREEWPVALSTQEPTTYTVRNSDFGPVDGDLFSFANPVRLTVEDSTLHDVDGAAIAIANHGWNKSTLTVSRTRMDRVEAGIRALAVSDREGVLTPVAIQDVTITGPTTPAASSAPLFPGILLSSTSGRLDRVTVTRARTDGVRLVDSGEIVIASSNLSTNGRDGLRVDGDAPAGLGPCVVPQGSGPENRPVVIHWPDPVVEASNLVGNAGAGIRVWGPHIPMVVRQNRIAKNALAGYLVEHGRAFSPRLQDDACGPGGYHDDTVEVDLPLSPLTRLSQNDFVGNGAKMGNLALSSDHRVGTLPATSNYWGVSTLAAATKRVACVGPCAISPVLSSPAQP